jgi:hypothetical protein
VADKQSTTYIPGGGPEAASANQAYEDALQQMLTSLDARKNRLFEPTLLAIAAGSAKPTQTGGWGESLGNVAKSLQESEAQQMTEAQKYAEAKLGLAGRGLDLERQKSRERQFQSLMGAPIQKTPGALPGAVKAAPGALPDSTVLPGRGDVQVGTVEGVPSREDMLARSPVQKTVEAPQPVAQPVAVEAPPGFEGVQGVQIAPPSSNFDRKKYLALASMDSSISPAQALKEAQEMEAKRYQTKESGVLDLATGMFYPFPKGEQVDRQIFGEGGGKTFKVDARTATLLDLYASTNDPRYFEVAERVLKGPQRKGEAKGEGVPTQVLSTEDKAAQQKAQEVYQTKRAESAAAKEDDLQKRSNIASRMYSSASDVQYRLAESPSFFGLFSRPGLMSSIGNLVNEAVQAGNTTVKLGGFEKSITQLMPGLKQADLDNVMAAAGSLAEIELLYTQELMSKQGQITEGERAIVRRIPGTTSSSPAVLKDKMDLLKMHAQRDIDLADAYKQFKKDNKGKGVNYNDFEESKEYENMKLDYEKALAKRFKLEEAIPTRKRDGTASGAPKTRDNTGARTRLDY